MNSMLPDVDPTLSQNYNLGRLQTWLGYELSSTLLLVASFFYRFALYLAVIAAVIFIPFLLKVLYEEKRYGWLTSFILLIAIPPLSIYLLTDSPNWMMISGFVALGLFYFYCALLKLVIPSWVD